MSLIGRPAPQFETQAVVDNQIKGVKLSDYQGKWVVLFFYPLDFTFVCPTEIISFNDNLKRFKEIGAEVIGGSVDSQYSHLAWINTPKKEGGLGGLNYPLISDMTKEISRSYDCLAPDGVAFRATYIIDPDGVIRHISQNDLGVGRNVEEVLRLVKAFQYNYKHGEVCPADWEEGKEAIIESTKGIKEYLAKHS